MKLFGGSDSKRKEDIQKIKEIRDIVDNSGRPAQPPVRSDNPVPPVTNREIMQPRPQVPQPRIQPPPPMPQSRPPEQMRPAHAGVSHKATSPPLFIKIEKYKEIVDQIHKLRSLSLTLRDALDALFEMERELRNGMEMAQKTLDNFNATLLQLDGALIRSQGIPSSDNEDAKELEEYVRGVYKQVQRLKTDMRTISQDI